MRRLRQGSYANVASTLALVIALGGTSYAAGMITGAQIKDGTVTSADLKNDNVKSRDIRNGTLTLKDFSADAVTGLQGDPGPAGPAGPVGATGPQGPRGISAWQTIPKGVTVKGQEFFNMTGGGSFSVWNVQLPAAAPVALTNATVSFAPDSLAATQDHDATCTGSYANPTAPAGKVCIYMGSGTVSATSVLASAWSEPNLRTRAFYVEFSGVSSTSWPYFTWAYTAP